jgi:predicted esterase
MRSLVTVLVIISVGFIVLLGLSHTLIGSEPYTGNVFEVLEQRDDIDIGRKYFESFGYRYTGGHYENELIPFRLHVPYAQRRDVTKKYPLIVFFHGRGNYGSNYHQLRCLRDVRFDGTFFLLAAACNDRHPFWGTIETTPNKRAECPAAVCLEIIHQLVKEFPVDKNEIHLIGYSDGTNAVSYMVQEGLKPKSAVYLGNEPPKDKTVYFDDDGHYIRSETDVYFYYGKDDPTFPHAPITMFYNLATSSDVEVSVHRLSEPYNGHDIYKYVFGDYQLIQKLVTLN